MNNKNLNLLSAEILDIKVLNLQDRISVEFKVSRFLKGISNAAYLKSKTKTLRVSPTVREDKPLPFG